MLFTEPLTALTAETDPNEGSGEIIINLEEKK